MLNNHKLRQSFKIAGKTSEGKDNVQKASLKHLPKDSFLFITSGTQAVIEDDTHDMDEVENDVSQLRYEIKTLHMKIDEFKRLVDF